MQVTPIKQIYDTYLSKNHYNPDITNVNETLQEIIRENFSLEFQQNETEFDWDDMDWILRKTKYWFTNNSEVFGSQKSFFDIYMNYLKSQMNAFLVYKQHKMNDRKNNEKITTTISEIKCNVQNKTLNKDDRLVLSIDIKLNDVHNTKLIRKNNIVSVAIEDKLKLWNNPPLNVQQLVNWPYIGFILDLPDISIVHQTNHLFDRYINLHDCSEVLNIEKKCYISHHYNSINKYTKFCNIELITMYITLCRQKILQNNDICQRRKEELFIIFERIIRSFAFCNNVMCPCHIDSYYVCTKYKLVREFICSYTKESQDKMHTLIEVMTPAFKISISRCSFDQPCNDEVQERTLNTILNLFDKKDSDNYKTFITQINKDIPYFCSYCDIKFTESSFYAMENHIHDVHGCEDVPWRCMQCNEKFTTYDLSTYNWRHTCE